MKTTRAYLAMCIITGTVLFFIGAKYLFGEDINKKEFINRNGPNKASSIKWEPSRGNSYNILFLGGDRIYNNTDTIILANINPEIPSISLLSIPRDTKVTINGTVRKLNFAYPYGGGETSVSVTEKLLGIEIDYYVFMDLSVFRKAIDYLGGVEFYVPEDMVYDDPTQNLHIRLKKGYQLLDGKKAEQLVRYRKGYADGDIGRIKVQQEFIKEVIRQKVTLANMPKLKNIMEMLFENIKTDITLDKALRIFLMLEKVDAVNVEFFKLPGRVANSKAWLYEADLEEASTIIDKHFK